VDAFQELKLGKSTKFIIFKLNDKKTEIIVSKKSNDADYDAFLEVCLNNAILMEGTP
jgi:cofilin